MKKTQFTVNLNGVSWWGDNSLNMKFNEHLYIKLFSNLLPDHDYIIVNRKDSVQQRTNTHDCGLYALAFIITLCENEDPCKFKYIQNEMTDHYREMNNNETITKFPTVQLYSTRSQRSQSQNRQEKVSSYMLHLHK